MESINTFISYLDKKLEFQYIFYKWLLRGIPLNAQFLCFDAKLFIQKIKHL